jgi:hypothetical protein
VLCTAAYIGELKRTQALDAGLLKRLTALQHLHIASCPLSDAAVHAVCTSNAQLTALTRLHLSDMHVRHASQLMTALCHSPATPSDVTPETGTTTTTTNDGGDQGMQSHALVSMCHGSCVPTTTSLRSSVTSPLQELELSQLMFLGDGMQLAQAISCMHCLRKLELTHSRMSDEDASSLILELEQLPLLRHINLSFCQLEAVIAGRLNVSISSDGTTSQTKGSLLAEFGFQPFCRRTWLTSLV